MHAHPEAALGELGSSTYPHGRHQLVRTQGLEDDQVEHLIHRIVWHRQRLLLRPAGVVEAVPGLRVGFHHLWQVLEAARRGNGED